MPDVKYQTIALGRILRHPENPNILKGETRERIKDDIAKTHLYPALLVRSLEESTELKAEHAQGMFQLLNGHQRLDMLSELGIQEFRCEIWPGVTDTAARLYVLNLNDGGEDDPGKRRDLLLKVQKEMNASAEEMERLVRESGPELMKLAELASQSLGGATAPGDMAKARVAPFEVFMMPEHREIVESAIERARETGASVDDPSGVAMEGAALAGICKLFLEGKAS